MSASDTMPDVRYPSRFVEVIVPLPLDGPFTYRIPDHITAPVGPGSRVIVSFGKRRFYTGLVRGFVADPAMSPTPLPLEIKDIISVLDPEPIVRHPQLKHWEWIAQYYLCSLGDVYKAAVPAGLKIESETNFEVNPDFDIDASPFTEKQAQILALLREKGKLTAAQISKALKVADITPTLQRLVDAGLILLCESLSENYRPKTLKLVKLAIPRYDDEALRSAFAAVKSAKKQELMLQTLIHLSKFTLQGVPIVEVQQSELLEKTKLTAPILKALRDKGIVETYAKKISRFSPLGLSTQPLPTLSAAQSTALSQIHHSWFEKQVTLLRGVTSSGKTEVYMHLIDYALSQRTSALLLVPEIALTTQLTERMQRVFGDRVVIYHSKFTDNERVDIWRKVQQAAEPQLIIGARSAIFLPFSKLGLVIVDEEHEPSYKQTDPAPRYNGRDSAIVLAAMHGAKTLLGSATPAIETYYKAQTGKYGLVELTERYAGAQLPKVELVDMATESKKKAVDGPFAFRTVAAIREALEGGRQAIVFNNRRGFAPIARCTRCEYIPRCLYCDVSLTYHRDIHQLVCHYCGTRYPMPDICPNCKEPAMRVVGYGTERIEDDVERCFPQARTLRMDLDTTRSRASYDRIISTFSQGGADILVGTQMVTKGLNFTGVEVVAVVDADRVINYPDFRSAERAFNMLSQVSGRAGRRAEDTGRVLVQTRTPDHPIFKYVITHDYPGFYAMELEERRTFSYPPFSRVILITLKHRDAAAIDTFASAFGQRLRDLFGTRVSGPAAPAVARVNSLHIRKIMLRVELEASMTKVKDILRTEHAAMSKMPLFSALIVQYDVDPY